MTALPMNKDWASSTRCRYIVDSFSACAVLKKELRQRLFSCPAWAMKRATEVACDGWWVAGEPSPLQAVVGGSEGGVSWLI